MNDFLAIERSIVFVPIFPSKIMTCERLCMFQYEVHQSLDRLVSKSEKGDAKRECFCKTWDSCPMNHLQIVTESTEPALNGGIEKTSFLVLTDLPTLLLPQPFDQNLSQPVCC